MKSLRPALISVSITFMLLTFTWVTNSCKNTTKGEEQIVRHDNYEMIVRGEVLSIETYCYDYNGNPSSIDFLDTQKPGLTEKTVFEPDGSVSSNDIIDAAPFNGNKTVLNKTYDDKGRLTSETTLLKIGDNTYTQTWSYEYNEQDFPTKKYFKEEGKDTRWVITYDYLKTDDKGNWIVRIGTSDYADANQQDVSKTVERRVISYYSE